jgi:hypothetical protein
VAAPLVSPSIGDYQRVFVETMEGLDDAPSAHWMRQFNAIMVYCNDLGRASLDCSKRLGSILPTRGLKALSLSNDGRYTLWLATTPSSTGVEVLLRLTDGNEKERLWRKNSVAASDKDKASYNLLSTMAVAFSTAWLRANNLGPRKMQALDSFLKL